MTCEYCTELKPVKYESGSLGNDLNNPPFFQIYQDEKQPSIHFIKNGNGTWFDINYCPMCGAPLTKPEPLSLEQLRQMDGEPVWVESRENPDYTGYYLINNKTKQLYCKDNSCWSFSGLGIEYDCYDRRPEQEGD